MSWSFSQTGPIAEVRRAFRDTLDVPPDLPQPEKDARRKVLGILEKLEEKGFSADWHVQFSASGSQSMVDGVAVNSTVNVSVTPVAA